MCSQVARFALRRRGWQKNRNDAEALGVREAVRLKWTDIDFQRQCIIVNNTEKNGNPRAFKASQILLCRLNALPKKNEKVLGLADYASMENQFIITRKRRANKLQNPRLMQMHFHIYRHWKATMEYRKTKNLLHVMDMLGHRNIESTLVYTQLISFESDEYHSAVANTVEEARKLVEQGLNLEGTHSRASAGSRLVNTLKVIDQVSVLVLAVAILISTLFSSLPLVRAIYTVEEHYMPLDSDDLQPLCGMKTKINGKFYVPNLMTNSCKIEMLFDNVNITGDQKGATSPYPAIANYPDGTVDISDYYFVSQKYGLSEGQSGWDYMADIVPDQQIDAMDTYQVALHYGKSGTYIIDLSGVAVAFDTGGGAKSPDTNGFLVVPQGATDFNVTRNSSPIGAVVTFWGPAKAPIAYSTTFEFDTPSAVGDDVNKEVHYYFMAKFCVPAGLSGQEFYFMATTNKGIQNVKLNGYSHDAGQPPYDVYLGVLRNASYHLLEFEFVDTGGGGSLSFSVATASGSYAWLDRFRIYVPNYSGAVYMYSVATNTTFSIEDDYFLSGYADDYLNSLHIDGLAWNDWMWNLSSTETINAWGDGFLYPLGHRTPPYSPDISFAFGNNESGLLDFQVISWTFQPERIGAPKFCALANAFAKTTERAVGAVEDAIVYGGSRWNGTAGESERFFESRLRINCNFTSGSDWGRGGFEIGLGVGWAKPAMPNAMNDMGVTVNFTSINYTGHPSLGWPGAWWEMDLDNCSIDVYSFSGLDLFGMEFTGSQNIKSIVNPDWTAALDYAGTVMLTVCGPLEQYEGVAVGLAIKGVVAVMKFTQGQSLPEYVETINEYRHRQVKGTSAISTAISDSKSSAVFFKLSPNEDHRCGLTKVVLKGTLVADACFWNFPIPGLIAHNPFPMADIEISIYIPWFIC